ncbi:MAG: HAD family phosphatase [Dehalococcoidia bacterium]|nr:HAD family phosphatase [Dehalococcoidia bacterium]
MGDRRIEAVIFDLGGVLIDWNPRHLYRKLFHDEAEMEAFLRDVCSPAWNLEQDRGRPIAEAVELLTTQFPHEAERISAFYARWPEMLGGPIEGSVTVLEELHEQREVRLLALTNWSAETFPHATRRFPFLDCFEDILVSGRERLVKPDPAIYRLLLERHGLQPGEALFIDDVPRNVAGARQAGLEACVFESPEALRRDLEKRGLLLSQV